MLSTGFSEVIGSWKITPISAPRIFVSSCVLALPMSVTVPSARSSSMVPLVMRPPA